MDGMRNLCGCMGIVCEATGYKSYGLTCAYGGGQKAGAIAEDAKNYRPFWDGYGGIMMKREGEAEGMK